MKRFRNVKGKATRKDEGTWSDPKVEELLNFAREYKSKCEFMSVDFKADLQLLVKLKFYDVWCTCIRMTLERQVSLKLK